MTTTPKVSLCKHGFPVQPPLGSLAHPGDCTGCGLTWIQAQQQLEQQETAHRLATAHEGTCKYCRKTRRLFKYQRQEQPWEDTTPPALWLCTPCWSEARENEEATGFTDFHDLFDRGSDEQLERGLRAAL